MKEKILDILLSEPEGLTSKDLAIKLRCPRATIARRLTEMKEQGLICGTGEYRSYAAIVVAAEQAVLIF